jgi:hypothetical protein
MSEDGRNPGRHDGASEDEMGSTGTDHLDLDRVLSGEAIPGADPELSELATAVREVRNAYVRAPEADLAATHLVAIVTEARRIAALDDGAAEDSSAAAAGGDALVSARRPPARRRRTPILRLAAVALAVLAAMAGIAVAGIRPPEPIADALEGIGLDVPGDDGDSSEAGRSAPADRRGKPAAGDDRAPARGAGEPGGRSAEHRRDGERSHGQRGAEASAEGRETAAEVESEGGPPTDPGVSEDHGADAGPPTDPPTDAGPPPDRAAGVDAPRVAPSDAGSASQRIPPAPSGAGAGSD